MRGMYEYGRRPFQEADICKQEHYRYVSNSNDLYLSRLPEAKICKQFGNSTCPSSTILQHLEQLPGSAPKKNE